MRRLPLELIERLRALRPTTETPKDHLGFVATAAGLYFLIAAVIEVWRFLTADIITPLWRMLRPWLFVLALALGHHVSLAEAAPEAICSDAAVVFCDNFEDRALGAQSSLENDLGGKIRRWDMSTGATMAVVNDRSFDGTKSLKFHYAACSWPNDGASQGCGTGYMNPTGGIVNLNDLYIRHYIFFSSNFQHSSICGKHVAYLNRSGSDRRPWHCIQGTGNNGSTTSPGHHVTDEAGVHDELAPNVNTPMPNMTNGQWHCIEIHLRNTGTKLLEMWIDDVQYWNLNPGPNGTGFLGTAAWDVAPFLDGFWNTTDTAGSIPSMDKWYDNVVVSTARIGCLGAPASPHGFILRSLLLSLLGLGAVVAYAMTRHAPSL